MRFFYIIYRLITPSSTNNYKSISKTCSLKSIDLQQEEHVRLRSDYPSIVLCNCSHLFSDQFLRFLCISAPLFSPHIHTNRSLLIINVSNDCSRTTWALILSGKRYPTVQSTPSCCRRAFAEHLYCQCRCRTFSVSKHPRSTMGSHIICIQLCFMVITNELAYARCEVYYLHIDFSEDFFFKFH